MISQVFGEERSAAIESLLVRSKRTPGIKKIERQLEIFAQEQFLGVNDVIDRYCIFLTKYPESNKEVKNAVLNLLIFDYVIPSMETSIQQKVFEDWDNASGYRGKTLNQIEHSLLQSPNLITFFKRLCSFYSLRHLNIDIPSNHYFLLVINDFLVRAINTNMANLPAKSPINVQMRIIQRSLNRFLKISAQES